MALRSTVAQRAGYDLPSHAQEMGVAVVSWQIGSSVIVPGSGVDPGRVAASLVRAADGIYQIVFNPEFVALGGRANLQSVGNNFAHVVSVVTGNQVNSMTIETVVGAISPTDPAPGSFVDVLIFFTRREQSGPPA